MPPKETFQHSALPVFQRGKPADDRSLPLLAGLRTPEQIAKQITGATGRTHNRSDIWDRALRIGIAKTVGRTPLIHVDDIPALLAYEVKKRAVYLQW